MKNITKLWIGLGIFGILSPLGLLAPGGAWGEWGAETFKEMLGFVPKGLERFSGLFHAPFVDYTVSGTGNVLGYIISAFAGMLLVILLTWVIGKFFTHNDE